MKKLFTTVIILFAVLTSCNINKDRETFCKLQGDWKDHFEQTFLFKDTLCNYLYPLSNFTGFKIKDDTIICATKSPDNRRFNEIKFHILKLDGDSLQVEYKDLHSKKREKLLFSKVKNKLGNNIRVDSIVYFMGWNSHLKPVLSKCIKLLNDSIIIIKYRYKDFRTLSQSSITSDTISIKDFDFINKKFAHIDYKRVDKYSEEYSSFHTDEKPQVCIYVKNELNNYKKHLIFIIFINTVV